jgi:hypothetical protein
MDRIAEVSAYRDYPVRECGLQDAKGYITGAKWIIDRPNPACRSEHSRALELRDWPRRHLYKLRIT